MVVIQKNTSHHYLCRDLLGECRPPADQPFVAAEIGVASGMNGVLMLRSFPELYLYLVDPWRMDEQYVASLKAARPGSRYLASTELNQAEFDEWHRVTLRDTEFAADRRIVMRMPSLAAAQLIPDSLLSFCFIDGDHRKPAVTADIDAWWPKVRLGGMLAGHDYGTKGHEEVVEAVDEWVARTWLPMIVRGRCWTVQKKAP